MFSGIEPKALVLWLRYSTWATPLERNQFLKAKPSLIFHWSLMETLCTIGKSNIQSCDHKLQTSERGSDSYPQIKHQVFAYIWLWTLTKFVLQAWLSYYFVCVYYWHSNIINLVRERGRREREKVVLNISVSILKNENSLINTVHCALFLHIF